MRQIIGAAAFVAMLFTALPASAQPDPYDYPYCLQGKDYGYPGLCHFTNYRQCQATASGTFSYCGPNPHLRTDGSRALDDIINCGDETNMRLLTRLLRR